MTEPKAPKRVRQSRTKRVETPGVNEVNPSVEPLLPVIDDAFQGNGDNVPPDGIASVQPDPNEDPDGLAGEVAEEAKKGNVLVQGADDRRRNPQIGDVWAGMVLTEHGWQTKE